MKSNKYLNAIEKRVYRFKQGNSLPKRCDISDFNKQIKEKGGTYMCFYKKPYSAAHIMGRA